MVQDEGKRLTRDENAPWNPDSVPRRPVYEGFLVDPKASFDGFRLGLITEPGIAEGEEYGDAFLIAPDDSRCGLIYQVGETPDCQICIEPDVTRWGVYNVTVCRTMTTEGGRQSNLAQLVEMLRNRWEIWRASHSSAP